MSGGLLTKEQVEDRNKKIMRGWKHRWLQNIAINYGCREGGKWDGESLLGKAESINNLMLKHKNEPCLVLGSGPSLEGSLEKIGKSFPGVSIAANSNLSVCLKHGFRPTYCHIFDGMYRPERIGTMPIDGIPMITCTTIHPSMVEFWKERAPVYAFNMFDPNDQLFTEYQWYLFNQMDAIPTSGSVAPNAIRLASYMGCNPIILVGLDLGFTGGKYRVAQYEHNDGVYTKKEFDDLSQINNQPLVYENGVQTWEITGILYKTATVGICDQIIREGLKITRLKANKNNENEFQVIVDEIPGTSGVEIINCTEGGIWKDEIKSKPLEQVLESLGVSALG